jgi:hypothetical protein
LGNCRAEKRSAFRRIVEYCNQSAQRIAAGPCADPTIDLEYDELEFRLTYQGPLLSDQRRGGEVMRARADHKQSIRKKLHPQLKRLWEVSPFLKPMPDLDRPQRQGSRIFGRPDPKYSIEVLAQRFSMFGYNFVPLVTRDLELLCSIEILFLRFGDPGGVINRVGDIDNRLKTVFDALSMPRDANQLGSSEIPDTTERPFFCLLEDDSLITKASVESDTLLEPISNPPDENDARLILTVRLRAGRVNASNVGFG